LNSSAPLLANIDHRLPPLAIALLELRAGVLDIEIRRNLPRGEYVDVSCQKLVLPPDAEDLYQTLVNDAAPRATSI